MSIVENLYKINRFWKTGKVNKTFLYKVVRAEFEVIRENLEEKRIFIHNRS